MSVKRSITVKVTFKEGYADAITLTGADAYAFNIAWHTHLKDQDGDIGFEYKNVVTDEKNSTTTTTYVSFLFDKIAKVERSEATETEYHDDECQDS